MEMSKRTSLLVVVAFTLVLGSVLLVIAATGFTSARSRYGDISATATTFTSLPGRPALDFDHDEDDQAERREVDERHESRRDEQQEPAHTTGVAFDED